jgi:hypothetical protein
MTHRARLATIPLDDFSEIVVSEDASGAIDIREWRLCGYAEMATVNSFAISRQHVADLIAALRRAKRRAA